MNDLLGIAAHNTVAALVLTLFVLGLTRIWRNPPVAHVLWLVVLLKLVAPPVVRLDWPTARLPAPTFASGQIAFPEPLQIEEATSQHDSRFIDPPAASKTVRALLSSPTKSDVAGAAGVFLSRWAILSWLWFGGAALCATVAVARIVRFERLLRDTLPASQRLQLRTSEIARRLGVRQVPRVRYVECVEVPFVWWSGARATIVLPTRLCSQFDDERVDLILAHELAHLRRRDHWVRALELTVSIVYWWNPLVWLIRRQIHQAEELCCDAWVRWAFPDSEERYAEVLFETAESLGSAPTGARLLPATPLLRSLSLKARIEMILEDRFAPYVSARSLLVVCPLALVVLASFVQGAKTEARADSNEEAAAAPASKLDASSLADFRHVVKFEQGATRFLDGDSITILEVRGTAETFTRGNHYLIRGEYRLKSHDRATVAAYITATDAENGTNTPLKVQSTTVDKGDGTFTLVLPMAYRGWPHVSFYPAAGGEGFGGNYFGTGDCVLKRMWGSQDDRAATTGCDTGSLAKRFKHRVAFETGRTQTRNGGRIEIREVWGTRPQIEVGGQYLVRGKYVLPSSKPGKLYFYATAGGPWGATASLDLQSAPVDGPEGEFELIHGMAGPGHFHLILTEAEQYSEWFADVYFGTGDNVYR